MSISSGGGSSGGSGSTGFGITALLAAISGMSLAGIVERYLLGAPIGSIGLGFSNVSLAISSGIAGLVASLADAARALNQAIFIAPARALGSTWEFAAISITSGQWAFLGPFTPFVMMGVVLGSLWGANRYRDRTDSDFFAFSADVPILSADDPGNEEDS